VNASASASAPALTREDEVQSKIGKVRTFSRYARVACSALFAFGLVGSVGILLTVVFGPLSGSNSDMAVVGLEGVTMAQLTTPALKVWAFLASGVLMGVSLAPVYQLYRLLGNMAAGAIYTPENVRRVRNIGILTLLSALLYIVIPVASAALVASIPINLELVFSSQSLGAIISAGLILLASWIMDVGLYEKDHAAALQRDADLVI
jgi:hypothetical protein